MNISNWIAAGILAIGTLSSSPAAMAREAGEAPRQENRQREVGDDHGGRSSRDQRVEAGDDRGSRKDDRRERGDDRRGGDRAGRGERIG